MEADSFAQEVKSMYKTLPNTPWVVIAKSFLKNLDTENIKDSDHPSSKDGYRSVFYGDRRRPKKERVTQLTNIHEFTLALANMLDTDKELQRTLMHYPHEDLSKIASFYAELNDYVSTARENSLDTLTIREHSDG